MIQQLGFAASFLPSVNQFEIVHTADLYVALALQKLKQHGIYHGEVIYCDESCFDLTKLRVFRFVQETAPDYVDQARALGLNTSDWYIIPNFVDSKEFTPNGASFPRETLGIPDNAFVILSVGALESAYKRMDWLIKEIGLVPNRVRRRIVLLLVGSQEDGTRSLLKLGREILGNSFRFLIDVDHDLMPSIYRTADAFALASTMERFGIAFLEAMASGLPVIHHPFPVTKWIVGAGGVPVDMNVRGGLCEAILEVMNADCQRIGEKGRGRVLRLFDTDVVIPEILRMYDEVTMRDDDRK